MPILSKISRRFQMLTTDATPDPPRVQITDNTHNLDPDPSNEKPKAKSVPPTPDVELEHSDVTSRKKSLPNNAIPTNIAHTPKEHFEDAAPFGAAPKEQKKPNVKTKTRSKQYKYSQGANVVNYTIVNSNGVKIGSRTSYICNVNQFPSSTAAPSEGSWSKGKSRQMPAGVESLTRCTDEITLEDIFVIKTHIGHGWRDLARRLSYSDGQIEQFEENYRLQGVDEVIYQLLLDWKQANTKDADLGNLISILWACQEYDCAERLVAAHEKPS